MNSQSTLESGGSALSGQVGHDTGSLVLRFERRVLSSLDEVWRTLTASCHREYWIPCAAVRELRAAETVQPPFWPDGSCSPAERPRVGVTRIWQAPTVFEWTTARDTVRWELSGLSGHTDIVCLGWIDGTDLDRAAIAGADQQVCFEQFVEYVETGSVTLRQCAIYVELARRYEDRFAAALADTD